MLVLYLHGINVISETANFEHNVGTLQLPSRHRFPMDADSACLETCQTDFWPGFIAWNNNTHTHSISVTQVAYRAVFQAMLCFLAAAAKAEMP